MIIGVVKEIHFGERRVAMAPSVVKQFIKSGHSVLVEHGAGVIANFTNEQYIDSGAEIIKNAENVWRRAEVILKIRPPEENIETGKHEVDFLRKDSCLICMLEPWKSRFT